MVDDENVLYVNFGKAEFTKRRRFPVAKQMRGTPISNSNCGKWGGVDKGEFCYDPFKVRVY